MTSLTTRQRDILKILLEADQPLAARAIAKSVQLSARQVNYSMKGLKKWLTNRDAFLKTTPGVGVTIECPSEQREKIADELEGSSRLQLVLTPEQRQQLICLLLLFETEPVILTHLAHITKVSRTTILSDLDIIELWYDQWRISLERRQNYGIWVEGSEKLRQQVISAFLWGDTPFGISLFDISFQNGLVFSLDEDAHFLPLVEKTNAIMRKLDLRNVFNKVVFVEDVLGGRFTDEAVLFLALVLSVLLARVKMENHILVSQQEIEQLINQPVWQAANKMIQNLCEEEGLTWEEGDIAYVAMYILASPRHERWPSELDQKNQYQNLFLELLDEIRRNYEIEDMYEDPTLRDGIINHLIPVINQHNFQLWKPNLAAGLASHEKYSKEYSVASSLSAIIHKHTSIELPAQEISLLAALLRASYIRLQPYHFRNVLVVCPSGMATAQLLTARLSTKFPRLGKLTVVSFRELDQDKIAKADLIITMMPLPEDLILNKPTVQVSPQLLPEDVEAITSLLS